MRATLNGTALPQADARPDVTLAIVKVRESSDPVIRLAPGIKRYSVSVVTKSPIPELEAELPISSTPSRFTVGADGRTLRNCVVASLATGPHPYADQHPGRVDPGHSGRAGETEQACRVDLTFRPLGVRRPAEEEARSE